MKINIDEFKEIILLLLSNLKDSKSSEIELRNDYYWDISKEQLYNPYDEPREMSLGQLSDDINEICRLTKPNAKAIPYDLKRIAEILKAFSIENPTAF